MGWVQAGSASGDGRSLTGSASWSGMGRSWLTGAVKEADMLKMTLPSWTATTRRAENDRPSLSRSTRNRVGLLVSPRRRK